MAQLFQCAPVVRVRQGSNPWHSCSGTVFGSHILIPLGLFSSLRWRDVVDKKSSLFEIECSFHPSESWKRAFVSGILPLWKMCKEFGRMISSDTSAASLSVGLGILDEKDSRFLDLVLLAGTLVLLKVEMAYDVDTPLVDDLSIGETIDVYGSPFPSLLGRKCMASRFQAYVSCVLYGTSSAFTGATLYLLDAQGCVPGTEGGPIVRNSTIVCGCLGYAITSPSIGASFHIGWPMKFIAHVLKHHNIECIGLPAGRPRLLLPRSIPPIVIESTVSIHLGDNLVWASGFLLKPTVVVTNAHALDKYTTHVHVMCHRGKKHNAHVRYFLGDTIDLAFLDVPTLQDSSQMPQREPAVGQDVVVSGFPLWNPILGTRACCSPKLTSGTVTRILRDTKGIAAFMTDAHVINGASGGPIVHMDPLDEHVTASLVGLACCNARLVTRYQPGHHHTTERIYPTLNFCIPSHCIYKAYDILYGDRDVNVVLRELGAVFEETKRVWANIHAYSDTPLSKL